MDALDATYGEGRKQEERKSKMNQITEFFTALWIGLITNMKKEAQTYKEEREQQKRQERKRKQENG